jgi:hypothetical protein
MFEIVNWLDSKRAVSGFFAIDPRDGEVRYRQPQFVRGLVITTEFVDSFLKQTISYPKTYYDLIQKGRLGYSLPGARRESNAVQNVLCTLSRGFPITQRNGIGQEKVVGNGDNWEVKWNETMLCHL